jgi:hypothetical protein
MKAVRVVGDGDVFWLPFDWTAIVIKRPTEFRKFDSAVDLIHFELFGIWKSNGVATSFFVEFGKTRPFGEEILERAIEIFQALLQNVGRSLLESGGREFIFPNDKRGAKSRVVEAPLLGVQTVLLQSQASVVDESSGSR